MESYEAKRLTEKPNGFNSYVPVFILTAVFIVILVLSEIFNLIDIGLFDEINGGVNMDMILSVLRYNVFYKVSYLLLILYVLFFRKIVVGAFVLPIIYAVVGVNYIFRIIELIKSVFNASGYVSGDTAYNLIMNSVFLVLCILMAFTAFKGFRPKAVVIVSTIVICGYEIYNLIRFFITMPSAEDLAQMGIDFDIKMLFSNICTFLIPVLFFVILMLIGINKNTPSVIEALNKHEKKTS